MTFRLSSRISFVGNHIFDSDTLRGQIATEESRWYKFLASNDNYDPDRLTFDREQLRRFYLKRDKHRDESDPWCDTQSHWRLT